MAKDPEQEELTRKGVAVVRTLLRGEALGWDNALAWAADWIEGSLAGEEKERTIEFGRNMAMSIRANKRQRADEETAQPCGGYYCSEEHGHIDCAPEKEI